MAGVTIDSSGKHHVRQMILPDTKARDRRVKAWLGVDPGASGAIAAYRPGLPPLVMRLSETDRDICDWLGEMRKACHVVGAALERVHSMPGQGVSSSFKFGESFGFCRAVLTANKIPFQLVTPQTWQKAMKCMSKGDKNITKQAAQRIWPNEKISHANADALLLAMYARTCSGFSETFTEE